ncbi:MAG: glycosyltransferase family 4 protein [Pseudomonadota bacterium]
MTVHAFTPARAQTHQILTLGFLSPHNPYDRRNFSGTPYFAARALESRPMLSLRVLGHRPPGRFERLMHRATPPLDTDSIDPEGLDAVIGLVASPELDRLKTAHPDLPVLHVTDATPAFLRDAYGWHVPASADRTETRLAAKADLVVYSSEEIAARAPRDLGLTHLEAETVPFGVNFDHLPDTCPGKPPLTRLNLLFVGVDWQRKGGDIAVAALKQLRAEGHEATLTIVGRCPEAVRSVPGIRYIGFLNKNRPRDAARLTQLYRTAHLLLLPSRADCSPMVVAEALAHGTPVLAAETGGIASLIGGDGAGRLLPQFTSPADWATEIRDMTANADLYGFLSEAGFDRARHGLSWSNWAARIEMLAQQAVHARQTGRGLKVAAGT